MISAEREMISALKLGSARISPDYSSNQCNLPFCSQWQLCSSRATIERHRESAAGAKQLVRKASERALASVEQRRRSDAEVGAKTLVKQLSQKALHEAARRTGASAHHSAYVAQRAGDSELPPSVSASAADHGSPGSPAGERGSVVAHFLQNGEGRMTEEEARAAAKAEARRLRLETPFFSRANEPLAQL